MKMTDGRICEANPRQKQRNVWIEDKVWELVQRMKEKRKNRSISEFFREIIKEKFEEDN